MVTVNRLGLGVLPPLRRLVIPVVVPPGGEAWMRGVCMVIIRIAPLICPPCGKSPVGPMYRGGV